MDEIEITVTGRKSGRRISNPVWFVQEAEKLYLLPVKGSDSDWYKNIVKTPTMRLNAGGKEWSADVRPVRLLSIKLCLTDSCRALKTGLKHGV